MGLDSIAFVPLGIILPHVGQSFRIGPFTFMYYGLIVAAAMIAGVALAMRIARKTGQDPELYYRYA